MKVLSQLERKAGRDVCEVVFMGESEYILLWSLLPSWLSFAVFEIVDVTALMVDHVFVRECLDTAGVEQKQSFLVDITMSKEVQLLSNQKRSAEIQASDVQIYWHCARICCKM